MSKQASSDEIEESTSQKPDSSQRRRCEQQASQQRRRSSNSSQERKGSRNKKRSKHGGASRQIPKEEQSQRDIARNVLRGDSRSEHKNCNNSAAALNRRQRQRNKLLADEADFSVRGDGTPLRMMTQRTSGVAINTEKNVSDESCCSAGCYIFCPPIPSQITRKLAFHPPKRGQYYRLKYITSAGNEVEVTSAKDTFGKKHLKFEPIAEKKNMQSYANMAMQDSEVFILRTKRKNYIVCLWFKSPRIVNDKVILFAQANATDLGMNAQIDITFHELSSLLETDVYCFDYSGYGLSSGTPSEKNIYDDIRTVYDHICNTRPNMKIILMGFSMGTAASIDLASKQVEKLAGVVLISPFTSGLRLIRAKPEKETTNCCDPFQSIDKAKSIKVPTLLIHGALDDVVPIKHSMELHKKLRKPVRPLYISKANHSNVMCHKFPECVRRIYKFIYDEI